MSREVPEAELQAVFKAVAKFPEGASIEGISRELDLPYRAARCSVA